MRKYQKVPYVWNEFKYQNTFYNNPIIIKQNDFSHNSISFIFLYHFKYILLYIKYVIINHYNISYEYRNS